MAELSKTVDQALGMLSTMRDQGPGRVAELARRHGISRTAARRMLATLERHGFARRTPAGFDLGFAFLRFGAALAPELRRAAAPMLADLVARFGETAVVAVRDGNEAVALDQETPEERVVHVQYRPGTRHPLAVGAHGRCILATDAKLQLPDADGRLIADLAEIARVGYAVSHDELEAGVSGAAAAIVDPAGRAVAAIGVVAPTHRFPEINSVAPAVVKAAAVVSEILNGSPPG